MSGGNSHFDEKTIGRLLRFADKNFSRTVIFSPTGPAEHNFRALGYNEKDARRKAKLNSNLLKNRAKRQLKNIRNQDKFFFADWRNEIANNPEYKRKYDEIKKLYNNNAKFREDARNTTKRSIDGKNPEKNIDEAVLYLLEELSFVLSCHLIYGAEKTAYLYHKNWEIYEKIIAGEYDGKMRENFRLVLTGITKNVTKK